MARFCLDPGHGGEDPGAVGRPGPLNEKDVCLSVALLVATELRARGQQVVLTRASDRDVDIYPRSVLANQNDVDFFLSIHCNASGVGGIGIETYYARNGDEADYGLARSVYDACVEAWSDHKGRGIKPDTTSQHEGGLGVLRNTDAPAALLELEFIDVPAQYRFLTDADNQHRYALAIADGLLATVPYNVPPSPVPTTTPTIIGTLDPTTREARWEFTAQGASEYRTRYHTDNNVPSLWTDWGPVNSETLTLPPTSHSITLEVQAKSGAVGLGSASDTRRLDVQSGPAAPTIYPQHIAYPRDVTPIDLLWLPGRRRRARSATAPVVVPPRRTRSKRSRG